MLVCGVGLKFEVNTRVTRELTVPMVGEDVWRVGRKIRSRMFLKEK